MQMIDVDMKIFMTILLTTLGGILIMSAHETEKAIHDEVIISASLDEAWDAWTTEEGIKSFFAPG